MMSLQTLRETEVDKNVFRNLFCALSVVVILCNDILPRGNKELADIESVDVGVKLIGRVTF